jgi:hypothetical protein
MDFGMFENAKIGSVTKRISLPTKKNEFNSEISFNAPWISLTLDTDLPFQGLFKLARTNSVFRKQSS